MFSTHLIRLMVIFGIGNYIGKVSTSFFEIQAGNFEWDPEPVEPISELGSKSVSLAYPDNVGSWYGTQQGLITVSCVKFSGAIRLLVPVLLPSGKSQTFNLDIPQEAVAEGHCIEKFFFHFFQIPAETFSRSLNSISLKWQSPILDTNEMVSNSFSVEFSSSFDENEMEVYSISKLSLSYYNAQFVRGVDIKKIEQQVGNLNLFPVYAPHSFACPRGELKVTTDPFHVYFFDTKWQAFSYFLPDEDFKQPFTLSTPSDCNQVPSGEDDDTEVTAFWKVWLVSTIIVFIVSLIIFGFLYIAVMKCLDCYRAEHDEEYETFA